MLSNRGPTQQLNYVSQNLQHQHWFLSLQTSLGVIVSISTDSCPYKLLGMTVSGQKWPRTSGPEDQEQEISPKRKFGGRIFQRVPGVIWADVHGPSMSLQTSMARRRGNPWPQGGGQKHFKVRQASGWLLNPYKRERTRERLWLKKLEDQQPLMKGQKGPTNLVALWPAILHFCGCLAALSNSAIAAASLRFAGWHQN